jgi:hypothetical protein
MTQVTGVQEFFEAMVEVRPAGGAWTDISGWGATVAVSGRERQVGEGFTHDGDHAIIGVGKLQPADVTVRCVYTEGGLDPYAIVLPPLENHTVLQVRWSPYGGQVGEKQYTTNLTHSHVINCPPPAGEAGSGDPIMLEFTVRTSDIAAASIVSGTFPGTAILDNFKRADEGPPPSSNWTTPAGIVIDSILLTDGLQVVSLECANPINTGAGVWGSTFNANQEAYVTVPTRQDDGNPFYIFTRYQDVGNFNYILINREDGIVDFVEMTEVIAGVATGIGMSNVIDYQDGDSFWIRSVDLSFEIWYKPVGGVWALVNSDVTTLAADGQIGLGAWDATIRFDDFGGGNC